MLNRKNLYVALLAILFLMPLVACGSSDVIEDGVATVAEPDFSEMVLTSLEVRFDGVADFRVKDVVIGYAPVEGLPEPIWNPGDEDNPTLRLENVPVQGTIFITAIDMSDRYATNGGVTDNFVIEVKIQGQWVALNNAIQYPNLPELLQARELPGTTTYWYMFNYLMEYTLLNVREARIQGEHSVTRPIWNRDDLDDYLRITDKYAYLVALEDDGINSIAFRTAAVQRQQEIASMPSSESLAISAISGDMRPFAHQMGELPMEERVSAAESFMEHVLEMSASPMTPGVAWDTPLEDIGEMFFRRIDMLIAKTPDYTVDSYLPDKESVYDTWFVEKQAKWLEWISRVASDKMEIYLAGDGMPDSGTSSGGDGTESETVEADTE